MSSQQQQPDDGEAKVRRLLSESFEPWDKSRQAVYHNRNGRPDFMAMDRHDDGEQAFRAFGMTPFHKLLRKEQRRLDRDGRAQVLEYPETYLNALVHLNDMEKNLLERNDLSAPAIQNAPRTRRKVLEFLAEHPEYLRVQEDGGTDFHLHSKPGRGKTSFLNIVGVVRNLEINWDTVMWILTLDELEILPLAPWTTILKPAGVDVRVTAKPSSYWLPEVEVALDDVFRNVVEYTDPVDMFEKVVPGGFYGVLPDPRFRRCERLVRANYTSAWEADEAGEVTPLRDFTHAVLEVRAKEDVFLHPTTLLKDELGDLLPSNPENNVHDEKAKVKEWPKRYGKARKKGCSFVGASHNLFEIDEDVLRKERWFVQLPRSPVPSSSRAGLGDVPHTKRQVGGLEIGQALVWDSENYVEIGWPNPYRRYDWHGEIDIQYPGMEAQLDALGA